MQANNPLIGSWSLDSFEFRADDGPPVYPLGSDARGRITYTGDGHMSVFLVAAERLAFASDDFRGGTEAERLAASDTFIAYAGRYRIAGDRVIHAIDLSWFPNWRETEQERVFELSGDTLHLRTQPFLVAGKQHTVHVIWRRIS